MSSQSAVRILPYNYVHVTDKNTNITRLVLGPKIFIKKENEVIVTHEKMIVLSPRQYCVIKNPKVEGKQNEPVYDKDGQVKVTHGDKEYRFYSKYNEPFPLYPGEALEGDLNELTIVGENEAVKIRALRDFNDDGIERVAGDLWSVKGLTTYYPRVEEEVITVTKSVVIKVGTALHLKATEDFVDEDSHQRYSNEEWLVREPGSYLPGVYESYEKLVSAHILTNESALLLKAKREFTDIYDEKRKAGEVWLVTNKRASSHIIDIPEELVSVQKLIILSANQYCVIKDPFVPATKTNKTGTQEIRKGVSTFFQDARETSVGGVQDAYLLSDKDALLVKAVEPFKDSTGKLRSAGERWMEYGPRAYLPSVEVEIINQVSQTPLGAKEGVYIRDKKTGKISSKIGKPYLQKPHEEVYHSQQPAMVKSLLQKDPFLDFDKVLTYQVPFNACAQVFNYSQKTSQIHFGPKLIMLDADETLTVNVLSGGKPKLPGKIKSLYIAQGPDFTSDLIEVETSDHCRMHVRLSYNWYFRVEKTGTQTQSKIFAIRDFIGDMCTMMAAKIRSTVASESFESFHENFAKKIRISIFGQNANGKVNNEFLIEKNNLVITNVDIQSVEPIDSKTKEALKQTVSLAIEMTTKNQEDKAIRESERIKQESQGKLEKVQIQCQTKAEMKKIELLELQAQSRSIKESGKATAEAHAYALANQVNYKADVTVAKLEVAAKQHEVLMHLDRMQKMHECCNDHNETMSKYKIDRESRKAVIETNKFEQIITTLGRETLVSMAKSGMESQISMLEGLGLKGYLLTDGETPINLFSAANGLVGKKET